MKDEEVTEILDGFEESTVDEEEVPHSLPDTAVEVAQRSSGSFGSGHSFDQTRWRSQRDCGW